MKLFPYVNLFMGLSISNPSASLESHSAKRASPTRLSDSVCVISFINTEKAKNISNSIQQTSEYEKRQLQSIIQEKKKEQ